MTRIDTEQDRIAAGRLPEPSDPESCGTLSEQAGYSWIWGCLGGLVLILVVAGFMALGMVIR